MAERALRKTRVGRVVSDKMDKTVVVAILEHEKHPMYKKVIKTTYKLKAHDENNECKVGDRVEVMETRPLSRDKRWRVVEDCVNSVGVELNTASASLLSYVSGLSAAVAKNIVAYREENGAFRSRTELKKVSKLGPKAYEQCAGFLRIADGKNRLDNTAVHPESYDSAQKLLELFGFKVEDVSGDTLAELPRLVEKYGRQKAAEQCGIGLPTLMDMLTELSKPGRDIRDELPAPLLRSDIMDMNDLKPGMELTGTVRNVIDFGAFVDIGVHQDGLVHISEISDKYIKHPSEVLKVGDIVKVVVLSVDPVKKRIALSMKQQAKSSQ